MRGQPQGGKAWLLALYPQSRCAQA